MKLKYFIIDNYKNIDHLEVNFNGKTVLPIIGGISSGKTAIVEALSSMIDLISMKEIFNEHEVQYDIHMGNRTISVTLGDDSNEISYQVMFGNGKIRQEYYIVNGKNVIASGESDTKHPFESIFWDSAKPDKSSIFNKYIYHSKLALKYHYNDFVDFFSCAKVITPEQFYKGKFKIGKYDFGSSVRLTQEEYLAINKLCKAAHKDLALDKYIDNGDTDNFCQLTFKGSLINKFSVNVRMILYSLIVMTSCSLLIFDDVNQEVLKIVNKYNEEDKQIIFTDYEPIIHLGSIQLSDSHF